MSLDKNPSFVGGTPNAELAPSRARVITTKPVKRFIAGSPFPGGGIPGELTLLIWSSLLRGPLAQLDISLPLIRSTTGGELFSDRAPPAKGKTYLAYAKSLYAAFKCRARSGESCNYAIGLSIENYGDRKLWRRRSSHLVLLSTPRQNCHRALTPYMDSECQTR